MLHGFWRFVTVAAKRLGSGSLVAPSNPGAARGRSLLKEGQMATIMVVFRQVPWFLLALASPDLPLLFLAIWPLTGSEGGSPRFSRRFPRAMKEVFMAVKEVLQGFEGGSQCCTWY